MAATIESDPASFFRAHYASVTRFIAASSGASDADVEDIVQDVLLRAWKDRQRFRGDSSALTWVLSIARTRALDYRRREAQRRRTGEVLHSFARLESDLVPDDLLEDAELRSRVRAALDALAPHHADVLVRRYQRTQSLRTMAEELGESEAAVESRLRRARDCFRELLNEGVSADERL